MKEALYGKNYQTHLLEQYRLYVNLADAISIRRGKTNAFFISVLSALLAAVSLTKSFLTNEAILLTGILGVILCYVWFINIQSYRQLNGAKFKVIHEMEHNLPFPCYEREWSMLGKGRDKEKYLQLTRVEQNVPIILAFPYVLLSIYALFNILSTIN